MMLNNNPVLELGEEQLAKLTSESSEIRMRALQQVETRFIRCLRLKETIHFKPLLLLKQLIRWFGCSPPLATDRVMTLLLELLRSEYGNVVAKKITYERLCIELEKVMKILRSIGAKRAIDLLEELQNLLMQKYNRCQLAIANPKTPESTKSTDLFSKRSSYADNLRFDLSTELSDTDYECAWTRASVDDLATMKVFVEGLSNQNSTESELQMHLTHLQIKMRDYPAEFFLQTPQIFLQLLQVQKKVSKKDTSLLHANKALLAFVKQLQERILIRQNVLSYAATIDPQETQPMQLRVPIAMKLLLNSCLEIMAPMILSPSNCNWRLLDLSLQAIRTYDILNAPVSQSSTELLSLMVSRLFSYCHDLENSDMAQLVENLTMPRLQSLILNGLLQDVVALNAAHSKEIDRTEARYLVQPILLDSSYLSCMPDRNKSLGKLVSVLSTEFTLEEQMLLRLKRSYSLALSQLEESTKLTGAQLLQVQGHLCLVITQMGSETLVKQLFDSIIECIPLYASNAPLRREAESLLLTLLELPDEHLKSVVFSLMVRPVVQHFHAIVNKSNYLLGFNNSELARQHIFGLPLNSILLGQLLYYSWTPKASEQVKQWCVDYLTMLLKLYGLLSKQDFRLVFQLILPVMPLMVCRSASQPQLHKVLWQMYEPDNTCLDPPQMLRGNLCYLFHPDLQLRKDATTRIVYMLQCQVDMHTNVPLMSDLSPEYCGQDFCLVQPRLSYGNIFTNTTVDPLQRKRSVKALIRLLQTKDLRESIRRSTLVQLNVLMQNWDAVDDFINHDVSYRQVLHALQSPLSRDYTADRLKTLLPAVSIFLKLLCHSADFRREMSYNFEVLVCLLRVLFLIPCYEMELRKEAIVCLFLLLFHEHITTNQSTMELNADLGDTLVPINCELKSARQLTPADEGLALEKQLHYKYFSGNANLAAQHWRFYIAHSICQTSANITLARVESLDIRDTLKIKIQDLALLQASQANVQLQRQLIKASNCSDGPSLEQIVDRMQSFLILLRTSVDKNEKTNLWSLIHKYIGLVPGVSADRRLYISLLELCLSCLQHRNIDVLNGLTEALTTNPHHSFTVLLRDVAIGLDLLYLICQCLVYMLEAQSIIDQPQMGARHSAQQFYCQYFRQLSASARQHFELRQLEHVRCLLGVLRCLSEHPLNMRVTEVKYYAQHFVQLSSDLRTSTQTGSQWQRDCLHILANIQACNLPLEKVLRYLLSLCGHSDGEVRALAWVSLANCLSNGTNQDIAGVLPRMDFLPGGLSACCLTTMLDVYELMLVRTLAGRVFIELIPHYGLDAIIELLYKHDFLNDALSALTRLEIESVVTATESFEGQKNSCEVISCYVAICLRLVKLRPSWAAKLCDHSFINGLSGVLKLQPPSKTLSKAYMELCSVHICELYSMMYVDNFGYLQVTVCNDPVFMDFYLRLYNNVLDLVRPERMLVHLLKLFLVMCKDNNAYLFLFDQLKKQKHLLLDIFLYGLHLSYCTCAVQRYTLSVISMVLTKVQIGSSHINFVTELEHYVLPLDELLPSDNEKIDIASVLIADKENVNILNRKMETLSLQQKQTRAEQKVTTHNNVTGGICTNAAVLLYHRLDRLFEHYFPPKTYNFLRPPGMGHVQICVAIGGLLKLSPWAVHAAKQMKLLDRVFHLLEFFLNDSTIGNASTYVRRVGANKCKDILSNLLVIFNMMAKWHSSLYAVITEPAVAVNAVLLLIRIWPWLSHSALLKQLTVQLAMFFTEHSFEMCKQTSLVQPGQSHSLLQLMVRVADYETTRKDAQQKDGCLPLYPNLMPALRVMINCCSCSDGRLALTKMHVLDMFDTVLPATYAPNVTKIRPYVLTSWLNFWECFSRYDAGAKPCHLHGLLNAVRHLPPLHPQRLLCLRICRNICFLNGNRPHFVNFAEFLDLLRDILAQPVDFRLGNDDKTFGSFEEQRLVVLILWKLFGFGAKYKAMLRGTRLLKHLTNLRHHLDKIKTEFPDKFQQFQYADSLSDLLGNLLEALKQ